MENFQNVLPQVNCRFVDCNGHHLHIISVSKTVELAKQRKNTHPPPPKKKPQTDLEMQMGVRIE